MSETEPRREFGRDGVSGLVTRARALRARLLPQLSARERELLRQRRARARHADPPTDAETARPS